MFGLNVWRSPEEVQQQRLQQLSTASTALSQQVEASSCMSLHKGIVEESQVRSPLQYPTVWKNSYMIRKLWIC